MNTTELEDWILSAYQGVVPKDAYRERSFFYNPDRSLKNGVYFATVKDSDGPNDKSSRLNREGVYRLSIGIGTTEYRKLFGNLPKRPPKGGSVDLDYDFTALNMFMPHPIYSWGGWICINNPEEENIDSVKIFLDISYANAIKKFYEKR